VKFGERTPVAGRSRRDEVHKGRASTTTRNRNVQGVRRDYFRDGESDQSRLLAAPCARYSLASARRTAAGALAMTVR
jgi:hypothetical protein